MRTLKYILLPILGILAALLAFRMAAPFEGTLTRPELAADDPRSLFTYGTMWGEVNRIAFGALICGPFCVVLSLGRRSTLRVVLAGALGALLGGVVNFVTDSSADLLGLALSGRSGSFGSLMAMLAWCVLVPLGIAFSITVALGITQERLRRALFATRIAAIASFCVQIIGGVLASPDPSAENLLQSQIPVWRMVEVAVGVGLGLTILIADELIRAGTIRLMHGRNEFRDWSLDHPVNRIGSAEGCEIPIFGYQGVEPVHAVIVHQRDHFVLDAKATTLLNGQPVTQAPIQTGDKITVGKAELIFSVRGGLSRPQQASFQSMPQPHFPGPTPVSPQNLYVAPGIQPRVLVDAYGQHVSLPPGRYGVGRENTNAFCLYNDPLVAPHHADIVSSATGLEVIDLGSPTGTVINGQRLSGQAHLNLGDIVEFGASRFTYAR